MEQNDSIQQHGRIEQRQTGFVAVRIRTVAGNLTSDQLRKLADLCDKYGQGQLHITTRQSVEIHWVQEHRLHCFMQEVQAAGLLLAVRGARILPVVSCPGRGLCRRGITDTVMLATQLNAVMVGHELPGKTKVALSGCPNSCAKSQINDIGLYGVTIPVVTAGCTGCTACVQGCKVGAVTLQDGIPHIDKNKCVGCGTCVKNCPRQAVIARKQGYALWLGGKIGRMPMLGTSILPVIPELEAISYIEAVLKVYNHLSLKGERIGTVLQRVGVERFRQEILNQTEPK